MTTREYLESDLPSFERVHLSAKHAYKVKRGTPPRKKRISKAKPHPRKVMCHWKVSCVLSGVSYYQCHYCSRHVSRYEVEKDHKLARSKGGKGGFNLVPCCERCNRRKGSKEYEQFLAESLQK